MDGTTTRGLSKATADIASVLAGYARSQPNSPAILAPGRAPLSFAALYAHLKYVQDQLSKWEIQRGDPVAILLPKGPEMATALACLPVSATAVPIDPSLQRGDYDKLFQRCAMKALVLLKGQQHAARLSADAAGLRLIEMAVDQSAPAGLFELVTRVPLRKPAQTRNLGPDIAYIMSTSGTTADRKLIPHSHEQIILYATLMKSWLRYEPTDLSLHLTPMHLAHGIEAALTVPLLSGTCVVCPPAYHADEFFALLEEYRPTWFSGVFTIHRDILRNVDRYRGIARQTSLKFIRSSGGRLETEEILRLEDAFQAPVIVGLASTEAGLVTCNPLPKWPDKTGSVGLTVLNEVRIRDASGQFLDPGQEGEIVVRGPLVFDGYLDDPLASSQALQDGWNRTGDLGVFDSDGFLYLKGRIKEVINRGGEKISPAEIDTVLETFPGVIEAAAFGQPHATLGEVVVAAIVLDAGSALDTSQILKFAGTHLSPSKVPRKIYILDALPRTSGGKLQRHKLPAIVS